MMLYNMRRLGLFLVIIMLFTFPVVSGADEGDKTQARLSISPCVPILLNNGVLDFPIIDFRYFSAGYGNWELTYQPTNDQYLWFYLSGPLSLFSLLPQDFGGCYDVPAFYFNSSIQRYVLYIPALYFNQNFYGPLYFVYEGVINGRNYFRLY
ncbi:MAG: hypothetical protein GY864_03980 [Desulfobacterales bacterium]|nr:hypothetical protein [Desulfobacterales bacterium]